MPSISGQSAQPFLYIFIGLSLALVLINVVLWVGQGDSSGEVSGALRWFDMDSEQNIPTALTVIIILSIALQLYRLSRSRIKGQWYWRMLAAIFLLLAIDEWFELHEMLIDPLRESLNLSGFLYHSWVIVGAALVVALVALLWKWFFRQSRAFRIYSGVAGLVYVGGTLLIESIGGWWLSTYPQELFWYKMITTVEESMEIIGLLLFLFVLNRYVLLEQTQTT